MQEASRQPQAQRMPAQAARQRSGLILISRRRCQCQSSIRTASASRSSPTLSEPRRLPHPRIGLPAGHQRQTARRRAHPARQILNPGRRTSGSQHPRIVGLVEHEQPFGASVLQQTPESVRGVRFATRNRLDVPRSPELPRYRRQPRHSVTGSAAEIHHTWSPSAWACSVRAAATVVLPVPPVRRAPRGPAVDSLISDTSASSSARRLPSSLNPLSGDPRPCL